MSYITKDLKALLFRGCLFVFSMVFGTVSCGTNNSLLIVYVVNIWFMSSMIIKLNQAIC